MKGLKLKSAASSLLLSLLIVLALGGCKSDMGKSLPEIPIPIEKDEASEGVDEVDAPLVVPSIAPISSPVIVAEPFIITIIGSGFEEGSTVTVDGVECTAVIVHSDTELTCELPSRETELVNIVILGPTPVDQQPAPVEQEPTPVTHAEEQPTPVDQQPAPVEQQPSPFHTIFASSQAYRANFNGLMQADAICATLAASGEKTAILPGVWKAVLSDSLTDAKDRLSFAPGIPIKNTNGDFVASSGPDLWNGNLVNPIQFDESGRLLSGHLGVWTGTTSDGVRAGNLDLESNCRNWTSWEPTRFGVVGSISSTSSSWIKNGTESCGLASAARLYCVNSLQ